MMLFILYNTVDQSVKFSLNNVCKFVQSMAMHLIKLALEMLQCASLLIRNDSMPIHSPSLTCFITVNRSLKTIASPSTIQNIRVDLYFLVIIKDAGVKYSHSQSFINPSMKSREHPTSSLESFNWSKYIAE